MHLHYPGTLPATAGTAAQVSHVPVLFKHIIQYNIQLLLCSIRLFRSVVVAQWPHTHAVPGSIPPGSGLFVFIESCESCGTRISGSIAIADAECAPGGDLVSGGLPRRGLPLGARRRAKSAAACPSRSSTFKKHALQELRRYELFRTARRYGLGEAARELAVALALGALEWHS